MRSPPQSISIVIPCFNEEAVIPILHSRLKESLEAIRIPFEVILVDDGSRDHSWEMLVQLHSEDPRFIAIKLSRNFGHQFALTCGLDHSSGEVVVIMDADLQDPPELIGDMIKKWSEGFDVVYGQRIERQGESLSKRLFAFSFYRIFQRLTGFALPRDTGDFRLLDRRALVALLALRERHRFIRGMVSWIGFPQTALQYARPQRAAGVTKYPFRKSLKLAIDALVSFSWAPLRLASLLGVVISAFAFVYIVVVVLLKIMGINFPGYTSLMASILLLGGVQLIVLGIIGEYVGRIFEQGQNRPLYLVDSIAGTPSFQGTDRSAPGARQPN